VQYIDQARESEAKETLVQVGNYRIGRNDWGLYVTDGETKAKFKPEVTEDQAKATTAEECADMIKSYKAWLKKKGSSGAKAPGKSKPKTKTKAK
jgi:hypothetical protein